jgi:hypothetical protein
MERVLNRDFNWVNYGTSIIGYDHEKNIFYRYNQFNSLIVFNNVKTMYKDDKILLISDKELDFLLELRKRNLPSLEKVEILEKYFNRIKIINSICS